MLRYFFRDVVFGFKKSKLHGVRLSKLRLIPGTLLRVVFKRVFDFFKMVIFDSF